MRNRRFNHNRAHEPNFFYRLIFNQRFFALIGLVIIILVLFPVAKNYSQQKIIEAELAELEANIKQYESDNKDLQELLQYLETEEFLKAQARLNLNLKEPGERVIVIEREEENNNRARRQEDKELEPSNLEKWISYFFR